VYVCVCVCVRVCVIENVYVSRTLSLDVFVHTRGVVCVRVEYVCVCVCAWACRRGCVSVTLRAMENVLGVARTFFVRV